MTLSSDDNDQLTAIGQVLLSNYTKQCPTFIGYGIYLSFFPYSIIVLLRKRTKTIATYMLFFSTTIIFVAATMDVASSIAILTRQFGRFLMEPEVPLDSRRKLSTQNLASLLQWNYFSSAFGLIIADVIVIWRAWVLYPHNILVKCTLAVAAIANTAINLCYITVGMISITSVAIDPTKFTTINNCGNFLSFAANFIATALIAYRAWKHREFINFHGIRKRTKAEKILILITETGAVLAVMQLVNAILPIWDTEVGSTIHRASAVVYQLTKFFGTLIPTLLIIILSRRSTSIIESTIPLGGSRPDFDEDSNATRPTHPTSTLRFASPVTTRAETSGTAGDDIDLKEKADKKNSEGEV